MGVCCDPFKIFFMKDDAMGIRDIEFVAAHLPWVRKHARKIARRNRHTDTCELVSTTCRRMAELPEKERFANDRDGKSYISRVMKNAVTDHSRREINERNRRQKYATLYRLAEVEFPELDRDLVAEVIDEMAMLSTGHRDILNLYCKGLTSQQIAAQSLNPSTVRTHIRFIKAEIRNNVEQRIK